MWMCLATLGLSGTGNVAGHQVRGGYVDPGAGRGVGEHPQIAVRARTLATALAWCTTHVLHWVVYTDVDWSHRGDYIVAKHGVQPIEAIEALNDPDRLVLDPDPASKSGRTARIIGWSRTAAKLLKVIVLTDAGREYGVNAWPANDTDIRRYHEATDTP